MVNLWSKIFNFAQIKPSLLLNATSLLLWRYASLKYLGKSWGLIFCWLKLILLCFALAIREIFCFDSVLPLSFTFHKFLKCHYWFTYSFVNKSSLIPLSIDSFILPVNSKSKTGTKYWLNINALQFVIFAAFSWWSASSFSSSASLSLDLFNQLLSCQNYVQSLLLECILLCGIFFKLKTTATRQKHHGRHFTVFSINFEQNLAH